MSVQSRTIRDFLDWLSNNVGEHGDHHIQVRVEDPFFPRSVNLADPKERDSLIELWQRERANA